MASRVLPEVKNYVKNVSRSFGYSFKDYLKDNMKTTASIIQENEQTVKDAYQSVRKLRTQMKGARDSNIFKDTFDKAKKNVLDDLRTGKFYNKDREFEMGDDEYADFDLSFDMSFDEDYNLGGDDNYTPSYNSNQNTKNDSEAKRFGRASLVSSKLMSKAYAKSAKAQTDALARVSVASAGMISDNIQKSTSILYAQNERIHASITAGFGGVTAELRKFDGMRENFKNHMENAKTYYEESLKLQAQQVAMMREFVEMQRNLYDQRREEMRESAYDKVTSGGFNAKAYGKAISSNIQDMLMLDFSMAKGAGKGALSGALANPLKIIPSTIIKTLIPKTIEETIKSFDKSLTDTINTTLSKLIKNRIKGGDHPLADLLGDILGVDINRKNSINPSNYKRGPVPFDGITRKSIVEVIPAYLARIEGAITGTEDRLYNYDTGTWTTARAVKRQLHDRRTQAISSGVGGVDKDINAYIAELKKMNAESRKHAEKLEKQVQGMFATIYEDFGEFKGFQKDAWQYYGFDSKADFDQIIKRMHSRKKDLYGMSGRMIGARQNLDRWFKQVESGNNPLVNMFNGNYGGASSNGLLDVHAPNAHIAWGYSDSAAGRAAFKKFVKDNLGIDIGKKNTNTGAYHGESGMSVNNRTRNILNMATDQYNNNIFFYLRGIYNAVNGNGNLKPGGSGSNIGGGSQTTPGGLILPGGVSSSSSGSFSSSDDAPISDDALAILLRAAANDADRVSEEEEEKKWDKRLQAKFRETKVGKFVNGDIGIMKKPTNFIQGIYRKIDRRMFKFLFGDPKKGPVLNEDGEEFDGPVDYIVYRIKNTFDDLKQWFKKNVWDKFKNSDFYKVFLQPKIDWVKNKMRPVGQALKDKFRYGVYSVGEAFANTFPSIGNRETVWRNRPRAYDFDNSYMDFGDTSGMARGGYVPRTGPYMLSRGEIVIPASFDKKIQAKQAKREREMKRRLFPGKSFSYAAEGTGDQHTDYVGILMNAFSRVAAAGEEKATGIRDAAKNKIDSIDSAQVKKTTRKVMMQIAPHSASIIADGLIGGGVSLLTGMIGGPLLGAAAGAGYGIIKHSKLMQNIVFGKETGELDEEGNAIREGGLIPPKIQQFFKKNFKSMRDTGIVGGVLGLIGPFGIIPGIAMGAGVGLLKNNEKVNKFLFGERNEETGEWDEGLIKKSLQDKFKKSMPRMAVGAAVGAIIGGPFGILGNAILGSAAGFATTTETFHRIVFGREDENGNRVGGLVGKINATIDKALAFGKKHILEPLKTFAKPFTQMVKNGVEDVANGVKDFLNGMFERTVGIPLQDFIQHKVVGGIMKWMKRLLFLPITATKAAIAAPFHMLGFIGNNIRHTQIRKGTASDMTAQERLDWRDQHKIRDKLGLRWDRFEGIDTMLVNQYNDEGGLERMENTAAALKEMINIGAKDKSLGGAAASIVVQIGKDISDYLNKTSYRGDARYSLYDKVGYKRVKKLSKAIRDGNWDKVESIVIKDFGKFMTAEQQAEFLTKVIGEDRVNRIKELRAGAKEAKGEVDEAISKLANVKGGYLTRKKHWRRALKLYNTEIEARKKALKSEEKKEDDIDTSNPAVTKFRRVFEASSDYIGSVLEQTLETINNIGTKLGVQTTSRSYNTSASDDIIFNNAQQAADLNGPLNVNDQVDANTDENADEGLKSKLRSKFGKLQNKWKNWREKKRDGNPNATGTAGTNEVVDSSGSGLLQGPKNKIKNLLSKSYTIIRGRNGDLAGVDANGKEFGPGASKISKEQREEEAERKERRRFRDVIGESLVGKVFKKGFGILGSGIKAVKNGLFGAISAIANNTGIVGKILKGVFIGGTAMAAIGWGSELLPKLWARVKPVLAPIGEKLKNIFVGENGIFTKVKEFLTEKFPGLFGEDGAVTLAFKKVKDFITKPGEFLKTFYVDGIKHFWENLGKPFFTKLLPKAARFLGRVIYYAFHGNDEDVANDSFWSNAVGTSKFETSTKEYQMRDEQGNLLYIDENGEYVTTNTGKAAMASIDTEYRSYKSSLFGFGSGTKWNGDTISEKWTVTHPVTGDTFCKMKFVKNKGSSRGNLEGGLSPEHIVIENTKTHDYIRLDNLSGGVFGTVIMANLKSDKLNKTPLTKDNPNFYTILGTFGLYDNTLDAVMNWPSFGTSAEYETAKASGDYAAMESATTNLASNKISSASAGSISAIDNSFPTTGKVVIWEKYDNAYQFVEYDASTVDVSYASYLRRMEMYGGGTAWYDTRLAFRNLPEEIKELTTRKDWKPNKDPEKTQEYITNLNSGTANGKNVDSDSTTNTTGTESSTSVSSTENSIRQTTSAKTTVKSTLTQSQKDHIAAYKQSQARATTWNGKDTFSDIGAAADKANEKGNKTFASMGAHARSGLGHLYQKASDIIGKKFGSMTMGDAGCGPVTAANMMNKLSGTGGVLDRAINVASRYIDNTGGTTTDYFKDYFGRNGYSTAQTTNKKSIAAGLKAGVPMVLLGNSGSNNGSAPFGANDHYINAYGMDRSGNVIAEDPDLPQSLVKYPMGRVMRDVKHSTMIGKSRFSGRAGEGGDTNTNAKIVYSILHNLGLPNTNIAGLLGNWTKESGIDPTGVEGIYGEPFSFGPKKQAAMANPSQYVFGSLKPRTRIKVNWAAYKGSDGITYPGIGIGGFTGPAATGLMQAAKEKGVPWYTLAANLYYATKPGGYRGGSTWFANWAKTPSASPEAAATYFLHKWEGVYADSAVKLGERQQWARKWYDQMGSWPTNITLDNVPSFGDGSAGVDTATTGSDENTQQSSQSKFASMISSIGKDTLTRLYGSDALNQVGNGASDALSKGSNILTRLYGSGIMDLFSTPTQTASADSSASTGGDTSTDGTTGGDYGGTSDPNSQWTWPFHKNTYSYISSKFGYRNISYGTKNHKGIDIAGGNGAIGGKNILAVAPGKVIERHDALDSARGKFVQIEHKDSTGKSMYVIYQHNRENRVNKGDTVKQGQTVAIAGGSGSGSLTKYSNHLHFEVSPVPGAGASYRNAVNPLGYVSESRKYSGTGRARDDDRASKYTNIDLAAEYARQDKPLDIKKGIVPTSQINNKFMSGLKEIVAGSDGNLYGPPLHSAAGRSRTYSGRARADYDKVLATIVNILIAISNNTSALNQILALMSTSGIKIDRSALQAAAASSRDAQKNVQDLVYSAMSRSGRGRGRANYSPGEMSGDPDSTAYLVQLMESIAKQ